MQDDILTIEAIRRGDTERYADLVERYGRTVYAVAWSRLGDAHLCEDAVQETFLQGFRFLAALRKPDRFGAWIARIARNTASAIGRRHRRDLDNLERWRIETPPRTQTPPSDVTQEESLDAMLGDALAGLPPTHRECLVLFYLQEKSVREGAAILSISEQAFKVRLHRARKALRGKMDERLEVSLRRMGPRDGLAGRVLAAAPAAPLGWGAGGLLSATGLAGLLVAVAQVVPFLGYMALLARGLARNYRDELGFRRTLVWRNFRALALIVPLVVIASFLITRTWGPRVLFCGIAVYCLPGLVHGCLLLRVNRTPFAAVSVLGLAAMFFAAVLMGFFGASFAWFVGAMLAYNLARWATRKSTPLRADYSLFLRAACGGLGDPGGERVTGHLDRERLRSFARFLGGMFLVTDRSSGGSGLTVYVCPVAPTVADGVMPIHRFAGLSTVFVGRDGRCQARLSRKDERSLRSLLGSEMPEPARLDHMVASVVEAALARFVAGDQAGARGLVEARPDGEIFKQPVHSLLSQKVMYGCAIAAALFILAVRAFSAMMAD